METIIENTIAKNAISCFLDSPDYHKVLLIIGPTGGGKTQLCKAAFAEREEKIQVLRPTYEDFSTHRDFMEHINRFITMRNMLELFQKKSKVLFLDDIDTLLVQDRYANSYIQELLEQIKTGKVHIRVLMTCTSGSEKRIADIRKKVHCVRMQNPTIAACYTYLIKTIPNLESIDESKVKDFIRSMHSNISVCLQNVSVLCTDESFDDITKLTFDKNILDTVSAILSNAHMSCKDLDICISEDANLIAYLMYDNVLGNVKNAIQLKALVDVYATASIMETDVYTRSDWILGDICNLFRCGKVLNYLSKNEEGKGKVGSIQYTTITTRSSNFYNATKRIGESLSNTHVSLDALQRFTESSTTKRKGSKSKEDSILNNYSKRICGIQL